MTAVSARTVLRLAGDAPKLPAEPPALAVPTPGELAPLMRAMRWWMSCTPRLSAGSSASIRVVPMSFTVPRTVCRVLATWAREPSVTVSLSFTDDRAPTMVSAWPGMGLRAPSILPREALMVSTWLGRLTVLLPAEPTSRETVARLPLTLASELVMTVR